MYNLRDVFTVLKKSITTEASKFMSKEQSDVRKGPNLKMQFKRAFKRPVSRRNYKSI